MSSNKELPQISPQSQPWQVSTGEQEVKQSSTAFPDKEDDASAGTWTKVYSDRTTRENRTKVLKTQSEKRRKNCWQR
jgi:hypothetical protein